MNSHIFNVDEIVSKSNSTIVKIGKLSNKKYRNEDKLFICNGIKLFQEAVEFNAEIKYIILDNSKKFNDEIINLIKNKQNEGTLIFCVNDSVFSKISDEQSPQGIVTVCSFLKNKHRLSANVKNDYNDDKIMIFESIRDPGNVGTIIRNAAAFGIDRLILSSDCSDIYSSKVIRAAMGAIFKVKIDIVDNLETVISSLKNSGKRILGAALKKDSLILGDYKLSTRDVVIIGNEGHGLSENTLSICDNTLLIPMHQNTESLNAAIASAIIMWESYKI